MAEHQQHGDEETGLFHRARREMGRLGQTIPAVRRAQVSSTPPWVAPHAAHATNTPAARHRTSERKRYLMLVSARADAAYAAGGKGKAYKRRKPTQREAWPHATLRTRLLTTTIMRLRSNHTAFAPRVAYRRFDNMPAECPHCGASDSVAHLLADCDAPSRKNMERTVARILDMDLSALDSTGKLDVMLGAPAVGTAQLMAMATHIAQYALEARDKI